MNLNLQMECQGSIASPTLYCIYMDELLNRLQHTGYGCWIDNTYLGSVSYADDLTLLSASSMGMKQMVSICETYAAEYGVLFNPQKSVCIKFTRHKSQCPLPSVKLSGIPLSWTKHVKHLGNHISQDLSEGNSDEKR